MRSDKAIYILLGTVLCCIMLSTFGKGISVDRRGLVHAMGIDRAEEGYRVSLQIFEPSGGGSDTAVDVTQPNVTVAVCEGKTVSEAVTAARSSTGKELFFGHLQLICLGSDTFPDDPEELFAFALGDKNISPSAYLCMAENTAEEIMQLKLTSEETSAEALTGLLDMGYEYSETLKCDLKTLMSAEDSEYVTLPVLGSVKSDREDSSGQQSSSDDTEGSGDTDISQIVRLAGTAIVGKDHKEILPDTEQALAAALLSNRADKGYTLTKIGAGQITSTLENCRTRRSVALKDGKLILTTRITVTARPDRVLNSRDSKALGDAAAAALEQDCLTLQKRLLAEGRDIFGTGRLISHSLPKLRLKYHDRLDKLLMSVEPRVEVKVKIA